MAGGSVKPLKKPAKNVVVAIYAAVGGPAASGPGGDGFEAGPTDPGRFVIAYCGRHSSTRYVQLSRIRWGSKIKQQGGDYYVEHMGEWRKLSELTDATPDELVQYAADLGYAAKMPGFWVFNDFGHLTCYTYKDKNKNKKRDAGESIRGEFIHTTPSDEAAEASGKTVNLSESHGCIHVVPKQIDEMKQKGYLKSGVSFIVHGYDEPAPSIPIEAGKAPYEVHFYPKARQILVFGSR